MSFRVATRAALAATLLFGGCNKDYPNPFGATALSNGNYVISSPYWANGAVTNADAEMAREESAVSRGSMTMRFLQYFKLLRNQTAISPLPL